MTGPSDKSRDRKKLALILGAAFAVAMIMGPGPGLYLINPDPTDPGATFTIGSVPVLYLWALFWFGVQATIILFAYFKLWPDDNKDGRVPEKGDG